MSVTYVVKQGESMSSIARAYGFQDYRDIYDEPANTAFRALRPNPNLLFPGDRVLIPDRRHKIFDAATGRRHAFAAGGARLLLRIVLKDVEGAPLANTDYELTAGSLTARGTTDGTGLLSEEMPADAKTGSLAIKGYVWALGIADLNPMPTTPDDGVSGAKGRLHNLGYDVGTIDATLDDQARAAVRLFQQKNGIDPADGELGAATLAALASAYGWFWWLLVLQCLLPLFLLQRFDQ